MRRQIEFAYAAQDIVHELPARFEGSERAARKRGREPLDWSELSDGLAIRLRVYKHHSRVAAKNLLFGNASSSAFTSIIREWPVT